MGDADWDNVTRIGSKVRAGGGTAVDRERVVKGKSAINAASRSGAIIGSEKKFASSNSVCPTSPVYGETFLCSHSVVLPPHSK